jgi:hypothetical protein
MASDPDLIQVRQSDDYEFLAALAGLKGDAAILLKQAGLLWFEVFVGDERVGGWVFIPKPCGYEMHTELNEKCHGKNSLVAFGKVLAELRALGVGRITSYAPHSNCKARFWAVAAGLRRVGADADNAYYERIL